MMVSTPGIHTHSGKLGSSVLVLPLGAVAAATLLGIAYAYVDVYSPIVGYISVLFVGGFAYALGVSVAVIGRVTKCRSTGFMALVGFLAGLVGLYVSWGAFVYAVLARWGDPADVTNLTLSGVLLEPGSLWEMIKAINASGWYSIKEFTPQGTFLWVMWGIEALIVVGGPTFFAASGIDNHVFCEGCNRWSEHTDSAVRLSLPVSEHHLDGLTPENLSALESLETVSEAHNPQLCVDTWHCPTCTNTSAIKTKTITAVVDKEGKSETETQDLTPIWTVRRGDLDRLKLLADRSPASTEPAAHKIGEDPPM